MVSLIAKFDGKWIELPEQLRGAAPGNVLVVYLSPIVELANAKTTQTHSIWDCVGKSPEPKTAEELLVRISDERESWDGREFRDDL